MNDAWVELHTFVEGWVDSQIEAETDGEARAVFEANRDRIIDLVETVMRRQAEHPQEPR